MPGLKRTLMLRERPVMATSLSVAGRGIAARPRAAAIMNLTRILIAAVLLLLFIPRPLFPAPLTIDGNLAGEKMGAHLDYFVDNTGKANINYISSRGFQDKFRPLPEEDYSFGYSDAAIWLRAEIINTTGTVSSWLLECEYPLLDDICLYVPKGDGYNSICTGDRKPFMSRPVQYRTFVFPIDSVPGQSIYYLRIASTGSLNISIMAWRQSSFHEKKDREATFIWMFYGILISLIIYNLFIFVSIRESSYLYLALFTISILIHSMSYNGLSYQLLWPGCPEWGNITNMVFNNISCLFGVMFTRAFLDTPLKTPRYDRLLLSLIALIVASLAISLFVPYHYGTQLMTFLAGLAALVVITGAIYLLTRGSRPARFFLIAWLSFILGVLLVVLRSFGLLHEGFLSNWSYQVGSSLVVLLLSLGIADKINIIRREREQALEATREAEEKYRALIETTDTGYVIIDDRGRVLDANAEYVRLSGHPALENIINKSVTEWTSTADREKNAVAVESCMRQGFIRDLELEYIQPDGTVIPVEVNATVIETREGSRILSICRDITYRKTVFDNLQASLREKEILLMEIHHRVKNNLQIISSLIALQAGSITDREALMLYEDLNSRVRAMSLIHERLYQSSDFARIDFAEYIMIITNDLQSTYRLYCANCIVEYDIDHIELDIVKAIPCGLMLNEIISNSFKYAFPQSYTGQATVRISFHERENDIIELVVSDNGIGLPASVDPEKKKTLGLSLIYLLADQINGTIGIGREGGTQYIVTFKKT